MSEHILGYDDQAQVMHVCNLFPAYKATMMLIHTKEETFNFLRRIKPDSAGTSTGAMTATNPTNPFAMMSDTEGPLQFSQLTNTDQQVQFDSSNFLEEAVDKLTEAITKLTLKTNQNYSKYDQKSSYANRPKYDKGRFQKPYKPYITKGQDKPQYCDDDGDHGQKRKMKQSAFFPRDRSSSPN